MDQQVLHSRPQPEKSFIRWAVEQGHTVFVISWVNPDERQAKKSFEHYMREGVFEALDVIEKVTGSQRRQRRRLLRRRHASLGRPSPTGRQRRRPDQVGDACSRRRSTSRYAGDLKVFVDEEQIARSRKARCGVRGYLEGSSMATAFNMLRSNDLIWPYVDQQLLQGKGAAALRPALLELRHHADAGGKPRLLPAQLLPRKQALAEGEMEIGGVELDLKKVKVPIYNLATREDHIAPPRSVFYGSSVLRRQGDFRASGSGHIAGVINPPSRKKYQFWTGPAPKGDGYRRWLGKAKGASRLVVAALAGWIEKLDDHRVKARTIGGGKLKAIENAPGSYVKVRA